MRSTRSLVPIALALGLPLPLLAADEIEVTFRYAVRPGGGGVDGMDVETFFVEWEAGGCD